MGYAVGLDKLINTSGDSKLCFRPLFPKLTSHLYIAWKKYQVFPKCAEIFLQTVLAHNHAHPGVNDVKAYKAIEKFVEEGKIRSIGLSNWYMS